MNIIVAICLIVITVMGTITLGYMLVSQVRQDKEFQRRMQELDEEIRRRRED